MKRIFFIIIPLCAVILLGAGTLGKMTTGFFQSKSSVGTVQEPQKPGTTESEEKVDVIPGEKNIMDFERVFNSVDRGPVAVSDFYERCLNSPNGFVIKIKATERYQNVLYYKMFTDYNFMLKDYEGYEDLPRDEHGWVMAEAVASKSHMLTDVIVQNIYYKGEEITFEENDIVIFREWCYLYPEKTFTMQKGDEDVLWMCHDDDIKLEPGKEYLIFGFQSPNGNIRNIGVWEGKIEIGRERFRDPNLAVQIERIEWYNPLSELEARRNYPAEYYDSSNAENVINDYIEQYRQYMKDYGHYEEYWR